MCSGVLPLWFSLFTSAPALSRYWITALFPKRQASCRAVLP
jgi:hypothetical protein